MWRWGELLPVRDGENIISLGEGDTPTLHAPKLGSRLGLANLYIKEEGLNPTGSFKARGISAALSKAKEVGVEKIVIPTAGNAGGALAAYAARGGLQALVFMPEDTPLVNKEESRITGAKVTLVKGLISDAAVLAREASEKEGWFDLTTFKEPYRTEGKKIMGYELAEFFEWELPDVIIYPTGGGTGLVGMWKAFEELEELGWLTTKKRPRMVSVQAEGCAPVVKAFREGAGNCDFWDQASTIASGLKVPKSFADRLILKCIRESSGTAVAVSDEEIVRAQRKLAETEGIFAAPEGAATLAALERLVEEGWVKDERVVLFNTGMGIKYIHQQL
jgi:threonine synthase